MYSLKTSVVYTATPGSFSNISITKISNEVNSLTTYNFSFTANDKTLAGSSLLLTFPPELQIQDLAKTVCTKITAGLSTSSQCQITQSTMLLTITSGFPSDLIENSPISFSIDNIKNYFCVKQSSTFQIATRTSDNYLIDNINSGIYVNFEEGKLYGISVLSSSMVNFDTTSYTISFNLKNDFQIGSNIIIIVPLDILINPSSSNCQVTIATSTPTTITNICTISTDSTTQIQTVIISSLNSTTKILAGVLITVNFPSVTNPRSLKPSTSFQIKTQTSDACAIDKSVDSIIITNTALASTSQSKITVSSYTTGKTANYQLDITPLTPIITSDILLITIPSQITLSNNFSITGIKNLASSVKFTITTNDQGLSVINIPLTINNTSGSLINDNITLQLMNLKNPYSLKTTDTFEIEFTTSESYGIEKYKSNLLITMTTPNTLLSTLLTPIKNEMNAVSDYTVQFTPSNIIPKDGIILIDYPSQITVEDGSCVTISGFQGDNSPTCTNDPINGVITLRGGFSVSDQSPTQIQFNIKGLKNQLTGGATSTDTFKLFTQTSDSYIIDQKLDGLTISFTCLSPCATCYGDQVTCLSCQQTSGTLYLLNGKCITTIPSGYAYDKTTNTVVQCNQVCASCLSTNKDQCISCAGSFSYFIPSAMTCVASCPTGSFADPVTKNCVTCNTPCQTCLSATKCSSCLAKSDSNLYYFYYPAENKCLASCPDQITVAMTSTNECIACDATCATCDKDIKNCTSCPSSSKQVLYQGKCIDPSLCPIGNIGYNGVCTTCDDSCSVCGDTISTCSVCKAGFILSDSKTCIEPVTSCPTGFYMSDNTCNPCKSNCLKCAGEDLCISCTSNMYLQGTACLTSCTNGYFISDPTSNLCTACDSSCLTCSQTSTTCLSCSSGFIFLENKCLLTCPTKYYYSQTFKTCIKCDLNCDYCTENTDSDSGNSKCTTCSDDYFNFNGVCTSVCEYGYTPNRITKNCDVNETSLITNTYEKFRFTSTYFIYIQLSILIMIIGCFIKKRSQETFYFGFVIALITIVISCHNGVFLYKVFFYGNIYFFISTVSTIILGYLISFSFVLILNFVILKDKEFKYWTGNNTCTVLSFCFLIFIFNFKIVRLLYSRLLQIKALSPKFQDYQKIHGQYRRLFTYELTLSTIPLIVIGALLLLNTQVYTEIWYTAIEDIALRSILLIVGVFDLVIIKNLNQDYYYERKDNPDVLPYNEVHDKKGRIKIDKRFDFGQAEEKRKKAKKNYDGVIKSQICADKTQELPESSQKRSSIEKSDSANQGINGNSDYTYVDIPRSQRYADDSKVNSQLSLQDSNLVEFKSILSDMKQSTKEEMEKQNGQIQETKIDKPKPSSAFSKMANVLSGFVNKISPKKSISNFNQLNHEKGVPISDFSPMDDQGSVNLVESAVIDKSQISFNNPHEQGLDNSERGDDQYVRVNNQDRSLIPYDY